jgi:hypothetical protein
MTSMNIEKPIQIFDLDGTLTIEFDSREGDLTGEGLDTYSYWHRITRKLASDPKAFDDRENAWLKEAMAAKDIDMIAALIDRTITEITLFDASKKNDEAIRQQAVLLTQLYFRSGILELDAIKYLESRVREGIIYAISTGGDEYGAIGFVDGLVLCGLLSQEVANKIIISGTRINWDQLSIHHMNVGPLKLRRLELAFEKPIDDIQKRCQAVFANDPEHGDRSLLEGFCQLGFVKKTVQNEHATLPANSVFFSNWIEIYNCKNKISEMLEFR